MKKNLKIIIMVAGSILPLLLLFFPLILLLIILLSAAGADSMMSGSAGQGYVTKQIKGSGFYNNAYYNLLVSHIKNTNEGESKGYVPLSRVQLFYFAIMENETDNYILNDFNYIPDANGSYIYTIETCINGEECSELEKRFTYGLYHNDSLAVQKFKEAYEINLNEDGSLISIYDACNKLEFNSNYCSSETLEKLVANGYDSFSSPNFFMEMPLILADNWALTSIYNLQRLVVLDDGTLLNDYHSGWDLGASAETKIYSACDGIVIGTNNSVQENVSGETANYVKILCNQSVKVGEEEKKIEVWYWHLYPNSIVVNEGDSVKIGDHIAGVGRTGKTNGNHLHLEVRYENSNETLDAFYYINWSKYLAKINEIVE